MGEVGGVARTRWGRNWRKEKQGRREGEELISGGKQETPGKLVSAVAPKTQVLPALGCPAVGSHTGALTSLSPFVKVGGSCRPPGYSVAKRKGGRAPRGGRQKQLGVRQPHQLPH